MIRRALLALCAAACAAPVLAHRQRSAAELMDALMWNREPIGGPFRLVDQHGTVRTDRDFRGRLVLVYFGFTNCSDVCPADLQQIAFALQKLGPGAAQVQPLFITLDPARDTPARLAPYVAAFDPRLLGLTGTQAQVQSVADAFRVWFRKVPTPPRGYTIDHAAFVYLLDRDGKYVGFFPPGTSADRMLEILKPHLAAH
jgi:cytochrome oxidase Cu insertion factor (SCO1/SenC/PrrC family)